MSDMNPEEEGEVKTMQQVEGLFQVVYKNILKIFDLMVVIQDRVAENEKDIDILRSRMTDADL